MVLPVRLAGPRPGRLLGLYALSVMEHDGPVYGYALADRISDRTDGAWRPGAGAIYPALSSLVARGSARTNRVGRRRVYGITPAGRAFLTRIRRNWTSAGRSGPDLGLLWSEIAGAGDPGQHLLRHLRRHLEGMGTYLERNPGARVGGESLRELLRSELRHSETRLRLLAKANRRPTKPKARGAAGGTPPPLKSVRSLSDTARTPTRSSRSTE
ncbi:MAG: PadR family transcriptional regulator [Thermoplasmata archaeon]